MTKRISLTASVFVILMGCFVLLGWQFDISLIKSGFPGSPSTMKANTALCFLFSGLSLLLLQSRRLTRLHYQVVQATSGLVIIFGLLTLSQYIFGWNLGIDRLLFQDRTLPATSLYPGRMGESTALNFVLLSIACLLLMQKTRRSNWLAQILSCFAALIALLPLVGHLFGASNFYKLVIPTTSTSAHTAVTTLVLCTGILFIRPNKGLMQTVTSPLVGGLTARFLLPWVIIFPLALNWFFLQGEKLEWYDTESGHAGQTVMTILTLSTMIWWVAQLLNQIESRHQQSKQALRESEQRLKLAVDTAQLGTWAWNVQTGEVLWSPQCEALFGLQPGSFDGTYTAFAQLVHPDDLEAITRSLQASRQGFGKWEMDYRIIHANGSLHWINATGRFSYDEGGQAVRMVGIARNITERKRAEEFLKQHNTTLENCVAERTAALAQSNTQLLHQLRQQQQVELALQVSQARLAGILAIANDAIISVDVNQCILLFNQGAERIFGYSVPEVLGQSLSLLLSGPFAAGYYQLGEFAQSFNKTQKTRERCEVVCRRQDGTEFFAEASFSSELRVGEETLFTVVLHDITKRKQAEKQVRLLQTLALAVSESPDFDSALEVLLRIVGETTGWQYGEAWIPCQDQTVLQLSQAWYCACADNEACDRSLTHFRHMSEALTIAQGMSLPGRIWDSRQPEWFADVSREPESVFLRTNIAKAYGLKTAVGVPIISGSCVLAVLVWFKRESLYEDRQLIESLAAIAAQLGAVMQRKQLEKALRESEARFQAFMNNIPASAWITDGDGQILYLNQTYFRMFQCSLKNGIGKTVFDLYSPEIAQQFLENIHTVARTQRVLETVEIAPRPDGTFGDFLVYKFPISALSGQSLIGGVAIDVTERKQAELELQRAKEAAVAANQAKSTFLANMSHELRTPLNAILGFSQLMSRDLDLSPSQQERLSIINRSGEHLLELINDILDMSQIEIGRMALNLADCDLSYLLRSLQEMFAIKAKSKGLQLIFERSPDVPHCIQTDEKKLRQILINLLGNAIKFTDTGRVTLRVSVGNRQEAGSTSNSLQFEVEDTGPGITIQEIDKLFDIFVQTETGRRSNQGTGLGLAISQKFAHLMEGKIQVKSSPGQGSLFSLKIPMMRIEATTLETSLANRRVKKLAPGQPTYRLLVVEDRWENRRLLVDLLAPIGFEMREAINGMEAIALWESWLPHLIWMDMRMPVMDGYEATKRIKAQQKEQKVAIVALTASVFEDERTNILSVGCDDFISKPFQEGVIFDKIAQHLGVRYSFEEMFQPQRASSVEQLTSESLSVMPTEWITQMHSAAYCLDTEVMNELIEQIPQSYAALAQALTDLVNNFDCDRIIELVQPLIA